jgi:hypothetical protein
MEKLTIPKLENPFTFYISSPNLGSDFTPSSPAIQYKSDRMMKNKPVAPL